MRRRQDGDRTALIATERETLGAQLSEVVEDIGISASVFSSLSQLESHADIRPTLVIVDLALKPEEDVWASLSQVFPRSLLWAVTDSERPDIDAVVSAFRHGCHDCLLQPISRDVVSGKLAAIRRAPGARPGELDRYMSNEIKLELPSDLSVVEHVVKLLAGYCREYRSYGPRTLVNLRVAVSEALSNAILYGNEGDRNKKVRLRANVNGWRIKVKVTDEGSGFDHRRIPDPTSEDGLEASGGRGLFLLRQLADIVSYNETGNSVTLTLRSEWEESPRVEPPPEAWGDSDVLGTWLERIRSATGADLHLWAEDVDGTLEHLVPADDRPAEPRGTLHWLRTPGIRIAVEAAAADDRDCGDWASFARDVLEQAATYEGRLAESRRELAERQEEIELLHSITETLGAVTRLEDAAREILKGVVRLTGAERASLWIYEPETEELVLAAAEGPARVPVSRVPVSASNSVSALAFRENRTIRLDEARDLPADLARRLGPKPEPWVVVPVSYISPAGTRRTVGVLNLIGRRTGAVLSGVGETRLLMTLARQIGSAVENLRLFEEIVSRERLIGELELAQDLQMKLLPDLVEFRELVDAAARCVPARPVGGDFYQLFKLSDGKIGAMLGDVTSHGFGASLIMALSMSVMGIYARETTSPGELLRAIHRALIQKLESTEMFMTVFYGVIDPASRRLCYANAGHAHAFRFNGDSARTRLAATSPPLGIAEYGSYGEASVPWEPGDLLCLFTDGLTNPSLRTTEEEVLQAVAAHLEDPTQAIVDSMFEARGRYSDPAPDDQTAFVLRS